jgi:hypothetical protein
MSLTYRANYGLVGMLTACQNIGYIRKACHGLPYLVGPYSAITRRIKAWPLEGRRIQRHCNLAGFKYCGLLQILQNKRALGLQY